MYIHKLFTTDRFVTLSPNDPHDSEANDTQMVHLRINEREPNPNPHVNFVTVLPMGDPTIEEAARQLLRALAAQVKPIMKAHGFVVNSLEEVRFISSEMMASSGWRSDPDFSTSTTASLQDATGIMARL